MRNCYTFRPTQQINHPISLQKRQHAHHLLNKIRPFLITDLPSIFLQPLLEIGLMMVKHRIYFEQTRTYIDIVFDPVPSQSNEIAVSVTAMHL